jgi:hypothetical protein
VTTGLPPPAGIVSTLAIDPYTPSTIYAGTAGGVLKSTDAGASWAAVNMGLPLADGLDVSVLAIDPTAPSILYAGIRCGLDCFRIIFKSTDGAATWNQLVTGLEDAGTVFVNAVAIDPLTPSTLYVSIEDRFRGVIKSVDAGSTWAALNTGLPDNANVTSLVIDPTTPTTLYAGTDSGVFSIQQLAASVEQARDRQLSDPLFAVAEEVFQDVLVVSSERRCRSRDTGRRP